MNNESIELNEYATAYKEFLSTDLWPFVDSFLTVTKQCSDLCRYFFAGNGASAAIASHLATDFSKALGHRADTFHDPALMTCLANDYGYENWISEALKLKAEAGDVVVLISSSGRSENILRAARTASERDMLLVTLTGPYPDESIKKHSACHLSVQSDVYNIVECCHMIALCSVVDIIHPIKIHPINS